LPLSFLGSRESVRGSPTNTTNFVLQTRRQPERLSRWCTPKRSISFFLFLALFVWGVLQLWVGSLKHRGAATRHPSGETPSSVLSPFSTLAPFAAPPLPCNVTTMMTGNRFGGSACPALNVVPSSPPPLEVDEFRLDYLADALKCHNSVVGKELRSMDSQQRRGPVLLTGHGRQGTSAMAVAFVAAVEDPIYFFEPMLSVAKHCPDMDPVEALIEMLSCRTSPAIIKCILHDVQNGFVSDRGWLLSMSVWWCCFPVSVCLFVCVCVCVCLCLSVSVCVCLSWKLL
jgi:hypothetical protein